MTFHLKIRPGGGTLYMQRILGTPLDPLASTALNNWRQARQASDDKMFNSVCDRELLALVQNCHCRVGVITAEDPKSSMSG